MIFHARRKYLSIFYIYNNYNYNAIPTGIKKHDIRVINIICNTYTCKIKNFCDVSINVYRRKKLINSILNSYIFSMNHKRIDFLVTHSSGWRSTRTFYHINLNACDNF